MVYLTNSKFGSHSLNIMKCLVINHQGSWSSKSLASTRHSLDLSQFWTLGQFWRKRKIHINMNESSKHHPEEILWLLGFLRKESPFRYIKAWCSFSGIYHIETYHRHQPFSTLFSSSSYCYLHLLTVKWSLVYLFIISPPPLEQAPCLPCSTLYQAPVYRAGSELGT